jgi:hypothetical protein
MRWAQHVAYMEEMRNSYKIYKIFVGKPAGQRPL